MRHPWRTWASPALYHPWILQSTVLKTLVRRVSRSPTVAGRFPNPPKRDHEAFFVGWFGSPQKDVVLRIRFEMLLRVADDAGVEASLHLSVLFNTWKPLITLHLVGKNLKNRGHGPWLGPLQVYVAKQCAKDAEKVFSYLLEKTMRPESFQNWIISSSSWHDSTLLILLYFQTCYNSTWFWTVPWVQGECPELKKGESQTGNAFWNKKHLEWVFFFPSPSLIINV